MRRLTAAACVVAALLAAGCATQATEVSMTPRPAHPGEIRMLEVFENAERIVQAADVPERQRFVMLDASNVATADASQAVQHVPIVRVRILRLNAHGELAPRDRASQVRILEYGPDERLLRATSMLKDGAPPG